MTTNRSFSYILPALLAALLVGACNKQETPAPKTSPAVVAPALPGSPGYVPAIDQSMPVDKPALAPVAEKPAGAPLDDLTRREESSQMPKPGQNNDHSSPALHPTKK